MPSEDSPLGLRKVYLASVVSVIALSGCQGTTTVPITAVYGEPTSTSLELAVGTCNAQLKATLDETASTVKVNVEQEDTGEESGVDCQDALNVELSTPLAGRKVVDASTGETVEVQAPS